MNVSTLPLSCSFCGKSREEVFHLVAGVTACICDACLDLSSVCLRQARERARPAPPVSAAKGSGSAVAGQEISAASLLAGAQASYAPAKLGTVTAVHPIAETGGLSFLIGLDEQKFLLSKPDLQTLWSLLGDYLNDQYRTNSQSFRSSDGFMSDVFSPDEVLK